VSVSTAQPEVLPHLVAHQVEQPIGRRESRHGVARVIFRSQRSKSGIFERGIYFAKPSLCLRSRNPLK
jgi:hypothetical protein